MVEAAAAVGVLRFVEYSPLVFLTLLAILIQLRSILLVPTIVDRLRSAWQTLLAATKESVMWTVGWLPVLL